MYALAVSDTSKILKRNSQSSLLLFNSLKNPFLQGISRNSIHSCHQVVNMLCFKKKRVAGDVQPSLCSLHQNLRRRKINSWRRFWNLSTKILKSWWRVWNSSSTILSLNYLSWWQEQKEGGSTPATCFALIHIGLTIWLHECMQDWEIPCRAYYLCP